MKIQRLVHPGVTLLDLSGPLPAWSIWPAREIELVRSWLAAD